MSVRKRIKFYCDSQDITISAFEKSINVSNGYVNSISKSIGIEKLSLIIENYSNLNIEWLLTGKGSMLRGTEAVTKVSTCPELLAENKLLKDKIEKLEGNVDTLTWCMEEIRQKYRSKNMANHERVEH